jgi:tRNA(Ile)-lysidine synthetase-like protein
MSHQIDRIVEKFLKTHCFLTPGGKLLVDRQQFTRLSPDMSCYVVREGVQKVTSHFSTISPDQAGEAIEVAQSRMECVNLSDGMTLRQGSWPGFKVEGLLVLSPKTEILPEIVIDLLPKKKLSIPLFSGRARMSISHTRSMRIPSDSYSVKLDASKVISPLVVRPWKSGDRFVMLGMKGSKKVGDILTDRKFPAFMRDEQLVVSDQTGIIWLVGHVIADRVKLTTATKKVIGLKFEIREDYL